MGEPRFDVRKRKGEEDASLTGRWMLTRPREVRSSMFRFCTNSADGPSSSSSWSGDTMYVARKGKCQTVRPPSFVGMKEVAVLLT